MLADVSWFYTSGKDFACCFLGHGSALPELSGLDIDRLMMLPGAVAAIHSKTKKCKLSTSTVD